MGTLGIGVTCVLSRDTANVATWLAEVPGDAKSLIAVVGANTVAPAADTPRTLFNALRNALAVWKRCAGSFAIAIRMI
jgi:hypothetical protein